MGVEKKSILNMSINSTKLISLESPVQYELKSSKMSGIDRNLTEIRRIQVLVWNLLL